MVMTSSALLRYGPKPYRHWGHRVFYKKFSHGYPPLSQSDLVRKGLLINEWSMHVFLESLLLPFYYFYVAAMTWRCSQWKRYPMPPIDSKTLIFCASGVMIAGKLGFSFGTRAARRFHSNIYNNMLSCIEFVIIEHVVTFLLPKKKKSTNCLIGEMSAINTDMACVLLANRNYHFKIF